MNAPPLAFRIVNWIGIVDQLASAKGSRLLAPIDVPLPQFVMLNHFSRDPNEARTVTGVARALQQPQPGITKTIQKMVARGWLREQASATDGRSKTLKITASGQAKHRAAIAALMPGLSEAFADWSQADQATLFALLDRLKIWFDAERDA